MSKTSHGYDSDAEEPQEGSASGYRTGGSTALLGAAAAFLAGNAGTGSHQSWTSEGFKIASRQEMGLLKDWADQNNLWIDARQLGSSESGGKEHDLFLSAKNRRILKVTKGGAYGWYPVCERLTGTPSDEFQLRLGTPLQYFNRLLISNELFPSLNRLDGFTRIKNRLEIVTSQPFFKGRNGTLSEIEKFLREKGFCYVCTATWFRKADRIALFDVVPSNILKSRKQLVPIDVIPIRAEGHFLQRMHAAVQKN